MKQDSAWKDVLDELFPEFLAFFFPDIHREVDWQKNFEFLDKELQEIIREGEFGKRIVDKLVKVFLRDGSENWILIHVEIQGKVQREFAKRMFVYNIRILEKYHREVISLAVLTDTNPKFRDDTFQVTRGGFSLVFHFPVIKLIDYRDRWRELEKSDNPFAIVVQVFLKTLETQGNDQERYSWKKSFLLSLYDRGLSREKVLALYRFVDWIMSLPKELDKAILEEIKKSEESRKMPYISTAEQIGLEKGKQLGLKKGERLGLSQGLKNSIYDILEIKFRKEGLALFEQVKPITDISLLQRIRKKLKQAQTLDDAKAALERLLGE